jgi:hypothetical protein
MTAPDDDPKRNVPTDAAGRSPDDDPDRSPPATAIRPADDEPGATGLLAVALTVLRHRPSLAVPFCLVGLLAAVGDARRLADSVPTVPQTTAQRGLTHVVLQPTPAPVGAVGTRIPAVLGLRAEPFVGVLAADGLPALAAAVATVLVVARCPGTPTDDRSFRRSLGVCVPALLVYQLAAFVAFQVLARLWPAGLLSIPAVIVVLYAVVRLWLVPATVVTVGPRGAVGRSLALTRGDGWTLFGLVVLVGLGANLLVSVPVFLPVDVPLPVGTALATAVLGSVHAVLLGVVAGRVA